MNQFKKSALVLAMTGAALTTGTANASSTIDVYGDPAFLGGEFMPDVDVPGTATGAVQADDLLGAQALTVDLSDVGVGARDLVAPRSVVYAPSTGIASNSTITFTVSNGAIAEQGELVLVGDYRDPATLIRVGFSEVVGRMIDFTTGDNGLTTVRFQILNELIPNDGYVLADYDDALDAFNPLTVVSDAGTETVTIAATSAKDPSSIDILQGTAAAEDVIVFADAGYEFSVATETSVIDVQAEDGPGVAASRMVFVDDPADTSTTVSRGRFEVVGGDVEYKADLTLADYVLTLSTNALSTDAVTTVDLDLGGAAPLGIPGAFFRPVASDYIYDTGFPIPFAGGNARDLIDVATGVGDHALSITTDGIGEDAVLRVGAWSMDLEVGAATDGSFNAFTISSDGSPMSDVTHVWDINGAQAKIPYHAQNVSGFVFFFNVVNESADDAIIRADVIVENKITGDSVAVSNVDLGLADANGSTTVGQAAIKAAINAAAPDTINDEDVYHVAMTVIVGAQQNSVQVAGFQKDPVGRTVVPVMLNVNNGGVEAYGDVWQQ